MGLFKAFMKAWDGGMPTAARPVKTVNIAPTKTTQTNVKTRRLYMPTGYRYYGKLDDLLNEPVVLIAGATGSGKSVFVEHLIRTIMLTKFPARGVKNGAVLYLADPKMLQLREYSYTPFCKKGGKYADTIPSILSMMDELISIMTWRNAECARKGTKEYDGEHIYFFIDELADLMISAKKQTTEKLTKLVQLCRSAKIHVIACTQCPNRTVISAPIQCNVTGAVALRCKTAIESRQVIGIAGAEQLPKHGKVLMGIGCDVETFEIPMIDRGEVRDIMAHWENEFRK